MALRGTFKLVLGLPLAVGAAVCAGVLWQAAEDPGDEGGPRGTADCAEVMAFARMAPPAGWRDGKCDRTEAADGRTTVLGTFRMEHADAEAWVASFPKAPERVVCPGPRPDNYDPESEGCFALVHEEPQPGRAAGLRMRITPEVGTTAKVRFDAS
ncbi:hypothetical protein Snoj_72270 [Streptomyces nojiriensis]|uniref:Uncharacterized protein n=1 Tax=Streptomyces nojiriensis TaxID=66374 RepID=A0ABQ3SYU0_9ACTN|nr:hypothetical protein [Streptomyces nojiriensis]QTI46822.1 hypothetical protein JYK04_04661 [Streptomyces nojiriensis]GGS17802.1 hypothetical protein GCM10010205_54680 [Streptomyces nojiriensis]GHI73309.1 hypothetical protein Snoj_72270 [Streptomyces nojiriensis]